MPIYSVPGLEISIHAPREGSDRRTAATPTLCTNFYPRSPRGERRPAVRWQVRSTTFLSTLPARGATFFFGTLFGHKAISIHAPREGSDFPVFPDQPVRTISIHAPREGSDRATEVYDLEKG